MPPFNDTPLTEPQRRLVEANMGLVGSAVKRLLHHAAVRAMGYEDAFGAGCLGLCRAARGFRPDRASRKTGMPVLFTSYAVVAIERDILRAALPRRRAREKGRYRPQVPTPPDVMLLLAGSAEPPDDRHAEGRAEEARALLVRAVGPQKAQQLLPLLYGYRRQDDEARAQGIKRQAVSQQIQTALARARKEAACPA